MNLYRTYMDLVANDDEMVDFFLAVHAEHPLSRALRESRRSRTLMEGPLADKIKATAKQVQAKYQDVQYQLLASATEKALNMFAENPAVSATLGKILKVGKIAVQNRALLTILVGIVGTMIGLVSNPAAASQAAHQLDQVFNGDIDHVLQQLNASGIQVDMSAASIEGLPPEIGTVAKKAAAALKAIASFEYHTGMAHSSERSVTTEFSLEGTISQEHNRVTEEIIVKTPDGALTIAHITTVFEDGKYQDSATGVKFDLFDKLGDLTPEQQKSVDDYINGAVSGRPTDSNASGPVNPDPAHDLVSMIRAKAPQLALLVAMTARRENTNQVTIGPSVG
jgi:hypothetical protein